MTPEKFTEWKRQINPFTLLMGVLNVTPDSFSDGGRFISTDIAAQHALKMEKDGADIIDIGGESSRPGADPVCMQEELDRVIPVIKEIRKQSDVLISIDTTKAVVADEAVKNGASMINDIRGMNGDPNMAEIVSRHDIPIVIMHMKGTPKTMQIDPQYHDVVQDVHNYFTERISFAEKNGIKRDQIILDPGIGFGKTIEDNFMIIRELNRFTTLGCPILVGPSRKSFIGKTLNLPEDERLEGTAASVTASVMNGARIVRVHDVKEMSRVIIITERIIS